MMTLLDSMKFVLEDKAGGLTVEALTNEINSKGLFVSKSGKPLKQWQVLAAVRKYRATFVISSNLIQL